MLALKVIEEGDRLERSVGRIKTQKPKIMRDAVGGPHTQYGGGRVVSH